MRKVSTVILLPLLVVSMLACPGRREMRGVEVTGLDRKLSTFAYIEEGDLVTLIVDTRATRYREEAEFIPVEIALANVGVPGLTLTRESFLLVDEQGRRYHVASPRDLIEGYPFLDMDRSLGELENLVFNRFAAFTHYRSSFTPTRQPPSNFADPVTVWDKVSLPRHGYIIDFIYFPRPQEGVLNQKFELHLQTTELPHPVFVKFEVL